MSSHLEHAAEPRVPRKATRALAACSVTAVMLLSSLLLLFGGAASDPVVVDNDDTRTVVWDFDDPDDYTLTHAGLAGGDAALDLLNETDGDHEEADYSAGTATNLDLASVPGSVIIGSGGPSGTYDSQPGPEGVDSYISEARVSDNFGDTYNLLLDSETDRRMHMLMWFNVSSIPSLATISDATLWLYQMSGSRGTDVVFDLHNLSVPFEESEVNWLRSESAVSWTTPGGDYGPYSYGSHIVSNNVGWLGIDVSELIEDWVTGAADNHGLILVPVPAAGDNQKVFQSSDDPEPAEQNPRLIVNYTMLQGVGLLESRALGAGTNATFTYSSFSTSALSHLDDDFSGTTLLPKWSWTNDPGLDDGSYDVGVTKPGWLHVDGSSETRLVDTTVTCNYLHQEVSGDFIVSTHLTDFFTASSMGAGLLLFENASEWMYIAKAQHVATGRVQVVICHEGTSALMADLVWAGYTDTHLAAERNSTGVWFYASPDGASYQLAYHHVLDPQEMETLTVGLFIYSDSPDIPEAEFDHFTVASQESPVIEVRLRLGNSTSFADASWEEWESVPIVSSPVALNGTSRYLQYRLYMSTPHDWLTPVFSGLDCWYELYAQSGMVQTGDYVATDFSTWFTLDTNETDQGGAVTYRYSLDHGSTWITAGSGGSYSIVSSEPSLMVRAELQTYDTLTTPRVHSVSAMYETAVSYLVVSAPADVVAGESFPITVTVKNGDDLTMTHWTGQIQLTAMEVDAATPKETNLAITTAYISTGGSVTIPNELYTEAGTMLIRAYADDAYGFSGIVTVSPDEPTSLRISPSLDTLLQGAEQAFTAEARDDFGNTVTNITCSWSADEALGTLDRNDTASVTLTAGAAGESGYLRVSAAGLSASLFITVTHMENAPVFTDDVPDQAKYEDFGSWTINLAPLVYDYVHADSELRWYIMNESIVDVSGENRTGNMVITLSTKADLSGTDLLSVHVVDPDGLVGATTFRVTIIPVNDWPVIDLVDPLVVHYDILYIYNMKYYVHDVDDDEDELVLAVDTASAPYVSADALTLYMDYPAELAETTQMMVVTVTDGAGSASTIIQVTVSSDNVPVTVGTLPDFQMYQGDALVDAFDIDDYFIDPDGDELHFAYGAEHVSVDISADHKVSFFAPMDWYGTESVVFSAIDPEGARVESATTVVVYRVNQAPVIQDLPDLVVKYGLSYELDLTWYVSDPDNDLDDLHITTDDTHAVPAGLVLTLEYPESMLGMTVGVTITVSDDELSDSYVIRVTVGNNAPPTVSALPVHSFQEDQPMPYPPLGGLGAYFQDEEGEPLSFEVFMLTEGVWADATEGGDGNWTVTFDTWENWHGNAWFVIRGTDPGGALVEAMAELTVHSVPDAPVLSFDETIEVSTGVQRALDLYAWASDPDMHEQGLEFSVSSEYVEYATVIEGVLVLEFPHEFLDGAKEREIGISVTASDPDSLHDTDTLTVTVVAGLDAGQDLWVIIGMLAMAGVAAGSFMIAMRLRKRPFVIKDIMVIHNDGFLIGRAAGKKEGEIDEDILSGMLTAVLNFVEDSMEKTQDGLRSFGFEHYKAIVKRGRMTYMAVVYEGDAPDAVEDRLGEFLVKVEKIYRKRIENWTGDMDTDFAGIDVLLKAFVKENSRKHNGLNSAPKGPRSKKPKEDAAAKAK